MHLTFPFSALVGQELLKKSLLLNVIDPTLGGVLVKGERGTAKSTAVRSLAGLLPTIRVVQNCPFQCDPDDTAGLCSACRQKMNSGEPLAVLERKIRLVNLPIGTTEDRLLGTIDIAKALKTGQKAFEPGLLAEAHRGFLYVDEVNLLNDQIVDLFLDAAASGMNVVEREGISFTHSSRFILVGTMNPEEGDLRPQLLDRFGLSVTVEGIRSLPDRVEIVKRRLSFEQNPEGFRTRWASADQQLAEHVVKAKENLPRVSFDESILETAAKLAVAMETDGHRADITMLKAARAHAALEGRHKVTQEDLQLAAHLALPHRLGKSPLKKREMSREELQEIFSQSSSSGTVSQEWTPDYQNKPTPSKTVNYTSPLDCATHLCTGRSPIRPQIPWHQIVPGSHSGRRFPFPHPRKGGVIQGSRTVFPCEPMNDISLSGTLRAAAPHQSARGRNGALKFQLSDLRLRKRSRKTGLSLMMLVDSSSSMRTNDRMSVTKSVIEALLQDLYLRRDKLGIITFRHKSAELVLPLTHNIRDAARSIERLPVGGRTPLAAGLDMGIRLLLQEKCKNPETLPVMLFFSDGRPNVSCFGGDPLDETLLYANEVRKHKIQAVWVDTEFDPMATGYGYEIAHRMSARYLTMDRLHTKLP